MPVNPISSVPAEPAKADETSCRRAQEDTAAADGERDVLVSRVREAGGGWRWAVSVGGETRAQLPTAEGAMVFARLLADLLQRRVWIRHGDGELRAVEHGSLPGCSCC